MAEFVKMEIIPLRDLNRDEKWLQEQIAQNPEILGIPDAILIDKERRQPRGARLDMLLEAEDSDKGKRRYEVEIQLGKTDESHIIRTIEYWDSERKRYPQYDHCAVIVAEDITSRFFNVIGLFNGHIPIIAIKVVAVKKENGEFGLVFVRVLDETRLAQEESESSMAPATRDDWVAKKSEKAARIAEHLCSRLGTTPRYTRSYIGMDDENAVSRNKVILRRKGFKSKPLIRICFAMETTSEWNELFERDDFCTAETWWMFSDESGYAIEVASEKQIDDNIELLRKLYREAAEIPQEEPGEDSDAPN